ncbi:MAG TPA: substrate-binding domain-containing protein, partial [Lacipirellulaceae bacterium]|nr:substrate-binding domain-containing protein [Lacipirellulaceae bacterium]
RSEFIRHVDPSEEAAIRQIVEEIRPDGIICSNDYLAARVMRVIRSMSLDIPEDIKLAGFDDVKYASLLPVPLTTIRQPCHEIGSSAIAVMVRRLSSPDRSPRDVLLNFELVIRASSGGTSSRDEELETAAAAQ